MKIELGEKIKLDAKSVLEFQATLLSYNQLEEALTAFATEFAINLHLDRVTIGIIESDQVQIKAISHSADVQEKQALYLKTIAAMDEAIEQASVIVYPETFKNQPRIIQAHIALSRSTGNQICTIPLTNNGEIFGALILERNIHTKFKSDEISTFENIIALLSPVLFLKWNNTQAWHAHLRRDWSDWRVKHFDSMDQAIKAGMVVLFSAIVIILLIPIQYNITAPAHLEGSIQRALVAPENGYLKQSYVRPGDIVKKNQLLVDLADQELQLEVRQKQSELAQYENIYSAAFAKSDRVQMVINQAKAEEARAQLKLAEERLHRSHIIAPFDGVIIKGDLKRSLGAPVQRGDVLLTIAPSNSFRLIVEVDEREISNIYTNQLGVVVFVSLPHTKLPFRIQQITPVSTVKDTHNFFEIEGELKSQNNNALRPGLEGVAKIHAGKHSLFWILTHRIFDWIKFVFWSWGF